LPAQGFFLSVLQPENSADEIFNVGTEYAITVKKFVETDGEIYKTKIPINWVSWNQYSEKLNPDLGVNTHFKWNMCPDISKISKKLGYKPKYTPEETLERAVKWMEEKNLI